jgi:hypothetical protein
MRRIPVGPTHRNRALAGRAARIAAETCAVIAKASLAIMSPAFIPSFSDVP